MRRAACAALACATLLAAPDARASDAEIVYVVLGIAIADVAYVTIDTVTASQPARPDRGVALVEAGLAAPQALLGYGLSTWVGASERDSGAAALSAGITTIPSFMLVHGAWGGSTRRADAGALYGVSWAAGADAALTSAAIGRTLSGHLGGTTFGVLEMVATAPQIAVATQQAATPSIGSTAGWIALDAWAAALFVHGAASVVAAETTVKDRAPPMPPPLPTGPLAPDAPSREEPPAPREPLPDGPFAPEPPRSRSPGSRRETPVVPGSTLLAPLPVVGGGGIAIVGALW